LIESSLTSCLTISFLVFGQAIQSAQSHVFLDSARSTISHFGTTD
jgi:hypothetical protein